MTNPTAAIAAISSHVEVEVQARGRAKQAREVAGKIWEYLTPFNQERMPEYMYDESKPGDEDFERRDDLKLYEVAHMVNQDWLHGKIGNAEAEKGTFARRLSDTDRVISTATSFLSGVYQAGTSLLYKAGGSQEGILASVVDTFKLVNEHAGPIVGGLAAGFIFLVRELCYGLALMAKGGQIALDAILGALGKGTAWLVAGIVHLSVMAYRFCIDHWKGALITGGIAGILIAILVTLVKVGVIASVGAAIASPYGIAAISLILSIVAIVIAVKTFKETKKLSEKFDQQFPEQLRSTASTTSFDDDDDDRRRGLEHMRRGSQEPLLVMTPESPLPTAAAAAATNRV